MNTLSNNIFLSEEEKEFEELVKEMLPLGFEYSSEVSEYIVKNKLGYKYKKISGTVIMKNNYQPSWGFKGGISPKIYARLCDRLGLRNHETNSHVAGFVSFEEENIKK